MGTIKEDADKYRVRQAQKLIDLFTGARGRPPATVEELGEWCKSPEGRRATPYHRTPDGKIIPD